MISNLGGAQLADVLLLYNNNNNKLLSIYDKQLYNNIVFSEGRSWPTEGRLDVSDLSVRYREGLLLLMLLLLLLL